jgi:hypothetical protein
MKVLWNSDTDLEPANFMRRKRSYGKTGGKRRPIDPENTAWR